MSMPMKTSFSGFRVLRVFVAAGAFGSALAAQAPDDGSWPMYSGSYRSERFSPLTQISASNVSRLHPIWVYQPPGSGSLLLLYDVLGR
jgi:glucose dehydrogenase